MAAGLCTHCRKPNDRNTHCCAACTERRNRQRINRQQAARAARQCVACGQPWSGPTHTCSACKAERHAAWEQRKLSALCLHCGKPKDSTRLACAACRVKAQATARERRASYAAAGVCVQCGQPKTGPGLLCDKHAARSLGDVTRWRELAALLAAQGGVCAYTGEPLLLGGNASLDHKTPSSRGGDNAIGNVHWVTWEVNRAKVNMTHDEFLALCHLVASRHPT
jgi:hypothetical protein